MAFLSERLKTPEDQMRVFLTPASVVRTASALLVVSAASSAHSIVGGTADLSTSVYQYMGKMSNGFGATPIASNWLVTAKHVSPVVGNTYTNPEGTFTIDQVVNHPEADISLVRIAGTLTNYYGYMNLSAVTPVTLTGYGQLGTRKADGTGYELSSNVTGARYITTNSIDAAGLIHFGTDTNPGPDFWAYAYDLDGMDRSVTHRKSLSSAATPTITTSATKAMGLLWGSTRRSSKTPPASLPSPSPHRCSPWALALSPSSSAAEPRSPLPSGRAWVGHNLAQEARARKGATFLKRCCIGARSLRFERPKDQITLCSVHHRPDPGISKHLD
ncbi:trypsin-like serine protease [bacterium]|nr:MAG: trypsin-like serine protease [bacterium]